MVGDLVVNGAAGVDHLEAAVGGCQAGCWGGAGCLCGVGGGVLGCVGAVGWDPFTVSTLHIPVQTCLYGVVVTYQSLG